MASAHNQPYPPLADYAFIGDCHSTGLVSRTGSVDWSCMPRFDTDTCFGRLLDWDKGGYCSIAPVGDFATSRRYEGDSLVLETAFDSEGARVRVLDFFAMRTGGAQRPLRQLLRIVDGVEDEMHLRIEVSPRFDFGQVRPWIRQQEERLFAAIGSDDGLLIWSDVTLERSGRHDLVATTTLSAGQRIHLSIQFLRPEHLDSQRPRTPDAETCDERLEETLQWWGNWSSKSDLQGTSRARAVRSAVVLKALTYAPTGAIAAAPTTSLPEAPGGERNWDYRFSWIRDSIFTVRSLAELGFTAEANGFRRFIERSAAGAAEDLQIVYGIDGERRLTEVVLDDVHGYRGARPVRIGNRASEQLQLDVYGELLYLAWQWTQRGQQPNADYWAFLNELVEAAAERWQEPDRGIWEVRGRPEHFVHSKVMCWAALDRGIHIANHCGLEAPIASWESARNAIRVAVERDGYDSERGVFVRAFGSKELDAALLLLPQTGFVEYTDERMVRTVDAVRADLEEDGLLARYRTHDGLTGREGTFIACTFWLAECLARQGRIDEARDAFERADSTANDLGLFAEEYLTQSHEMAGNFPQGLTHLSHIGAVLALDGGA
jgi:GH15 family glucan-1,4-alpha-glucosidase